MIRAKALTADPSFTQYVDVDEDPGSWEKVKRDAMGRITVEDGTDRRAVKAAQPEPGFALHFVYWFSYRNRCKPYRFYISGLPLEFGYV